MVGIGIRQKYIRASIPSEFSDSGTIYQLVLNSHFFDIDITFSLATDFLTELRNDNLPQISGSRKLIAGLLVDYIRDTNLSTSLNALKSLERKHRDIFFIWSDYMISKEKAQKLGVKNKYVIRPPSWLVIYNKRSFMMPPDYILGEESCIQFVHDVINKTQEEFK